MSRFLNDKEIVETLDENADSLSLSESEGDSDLDLVEMEDLDLDKDDELLNDLDEENDCDEEMDIHPPKSKKVKQVEYEWQDDEFTPIVFDFDKALSGVTKYSNVSVCPSELDIFLEIFNDDILIKIIEETNRYYSQTVESLEGSGKSLKFKWKEVDRSEMLVFFGLCMLMSQTRKHSIDSYWTVDPLIATPTFRKYMSRDRFRLILRFLHFNDNMNKTSYRDHKILPVVDHLNDIFKKMMVPFQNLCIDESLVLFKGRLSFKQYIPSKRHRFGVKLFLLCDTETGFVLKIILYLGSQTRINEIPSANLGKSGEVVMALLEDYLGKGHSLYIDNWYTSPNLFSYLHERQTNACGTVKVNRKGMRKRNQKLTPGEIICAHTNVFMHLTWMDKKPVNMLTTMHGSEMVATKVDGRTGQIKEKPVCIRDYNQNMGAVDRSDMMLSFIECARKSQKWYKKLFFHLMDVVVLNSFSIWQSKSGEKKSLGSFQLELCRQLLEKFCITNDPVLVSKGLRGLPPTRLIGQHFPGKLPPSKCKLNPTRACHHCTNIKLKIRKETSYFCKTCNVSLCIVPCFEEFHSQ